MYAVEKEIVKYAQKYALAVKAKAMEVFNETDPDKVEVILTGTDLFGRERDNGRDSYIYRDGSDCITDERIR